MKQALLAHRVAGLVLVAACAGPPPGGLSPLSVTRLGTPELFGPGIVAAAGAQAEFRLTSAAYVIVLRIDADGSIEPVFPPGRDDAAALSLEQPGSHFVTAREPAPATPAPTYEPVIRSAAALARHGHPAPLPPSEGRDSVTSARSYWLLVVADVATSAREVRSRLQATRLQFPTLKAELEALPRVLVAARTTQWAAYYVPAPPP